MTAKAHSDTLKPALGADDVISAVLKMKSGLFIRYYAAVSLLFPANRQRNGKAVNQKPCAAITCCLHGANLKWPPANAVP